MGKYRSLRLLSWIGHVNTIEWSHCVTLFSHHSHLCHHSWFYHYVIVILYGHRVKAPQCSGGDYRFLNYHTIFIPEHSVPNCPEICYDKIMYFKGLYCTKVQNHFTISKTGKFINPHWLHGNFESWSPTLRLKYSHMLWFRTVKFYTCLKETPFDNSCRCKCSGANPKQQP